MFINNYYEAHSSIEKFPDDVVGLEVDRQLNEKEMTDHLSIKKSWGIARPMISSVEIGVFKGDAVLGLFPENQLKNVATQTPSRLQITH